MKYKFNKNGTRVTAYKAGNRIQTRLGTSFTEEIKVATINFPQAAMAFGCPGSQDEKTARNSKFITKICDVEYEEFANDDDKKEISEAIPRLRQQCFSRTFTQMMITVAEVSNSISENINPIAKDDLKAIMEKNCKPKIINQFLFPDGLSPLDKTKKDLEVVLNFLKGLK